MLQQFEQDNIVKLGMIFKRLSDQQLAFVAQYDLGTLSLPPNVYLIKFNKQTSAIDFTAQQPYHHVAYGIFGDDPKIITALGSDFILRANGQADQTNNCVTFKNEPTEASSIFFPYEHSFQADSADIKDNESELSVSDITLTQLDIGTYSTLSEFEIDLTKAGL